MAGVTDTLSRHEGGKGCEQGACQSAARRFTLTERLTAVVLTVIALCLHGLNFFAVGGLWRDEANSVTLALLPDMGSVWTALQHDSFPVLHYVVIRGWAQLFGAGDPSLRLLGLVVGILLVAAFWYKNLRLDSRGAPLISLLLICLNPVMIRFLDAIRPNGLAALALVLSFTVVWLTVRQTDTKHLMTATILLVCCVQLLFQSAILVLALGIAAIVAAFYLGGVRRVLLVAVPFVCAALSLFPYRGHIQRAAEWAPVAMAPPDSRELIPGLLKAVNVPFPWMKWLWLVMVILAICGMIRGIRCASTRQSLNRERVARCLYCGLTMVLSIVLFVVFLAKGTGIAPKAWHYIPVLVIVVAAAESMFFEMVTTFRRSIALMALAAVLTTATLGYAVNLLQVRFTSMDMVAAAIAREAGPNDLIVLVPWFYGISFHRYYHGRAPWISFPTLRENSLHRFDLLKERMTRPETMADDLAIIMTTLQRGGRVWVVGTAFAMDTGTKIELLPAAPLPGSGWSSSPYLTNWSKYLMSALALHAREGEQLSLNAPGEAAPQESPLIRVYNGYKE